MLSPTRTRIGTRGRWKTWNSARAARPQTLTHSLAQGAAPASTIRSRSPQSPHSCLVGPATPRGRPIRTPNLETGSESVDAVEQIEHAIAASAPAPAAAAKRVPAVLRRLMECPEAVLDVSVQAQRSSRSTRSASSRSPPTSRRASGCRASRTARRSREARARSESRVPQDTVHCILHVHYIVRV